MKHYGANHGAHHCMPLFSPTTAYGLEAFSGSFPHRRLSNRRLPYFFIYEVTWNTTIPFEKLFHGHYYFLHTFFPTWNQLQHVACESRLRNTVRTLLENFRVKILVDVENSPIYGILLQCRELNNVKEVTTNHTNNEFTFPCLESRKFHSFNLDSSKHIQTKTKLKLEDTHKGWSGTDIYLFKQ